MSCCAAPSQDTTPGGVKQVTVVVLVNQFAKDVFKFAEHVLLRQATQQVGASEFIWEVQPGPPDIV